MKCPKCEYIHEEMFNFCPVCGYKLIKIEDLPDCRNIEIYSFIKFMKELRLFFAKENHIPAYCIFTDKALASLVEYRNKIRNKEDIFLIKYWGKVNVERFGDDIMSYLSNPK